MKDDFEFHRIVVWGGPGSAISVELKTEPRVSVKAPRAEAMRIPADLINDWDPQSRRAARLAGGALARAGRSAHPAESDAIEAALAASYRAASRPAERKELLSTLGNSAGPRAMLLLRGALN